MYDVDWNDLRKHGLDRCEHLEWDEQREKWIDYLKTLPEADKVPESAILMVANQIMHRGVDGYINYVHNRMQEKGVSSAEAGKKRPHRETEEDQGVVL